MSYSELAQILTVRPLTTTSLPNPRARSAPFKASWTHTVDLLARELRMLGAANVVLELDIAPEHFRLDGLPRASARLRSQRVVLSFKPMGLSSSGDLHYDVDTFDDWQDNVRGIALGLQALRAVDRYGVTDDGQQYRGWAALPAGAGPTEKRGREIIAQEGGVTKALRATHPDTRKPNYDTTDYESVVMARDAERKAA